MNLEQQIVIISAEKNENRFERNRMLTENMEFYLGEKNYRFKRVVINNGSGYGEGFVVVVKTNDQKEELVNLALKEFSQNSVLYKDVNGYTYNIDSNSEVMINRMKCLGHKFVVDTRDLNYFVIMDDLIYS